MKALINIVLTFVLIFLIALFFNIAFKNNEIALKIPVPFQEKEIRRITSIDTMKYSRDLAREKLNDSAFDEIINRQISEIASTGATHVAIATPYDKEFFPFLTRWVTAAREYKLNVWFRGNWSGWENWFNYPSIDRKTHIIKTVEFIEKNKDIFEDGDIFVTCNECENGGPGDPRHNGDIAGHREFLIAEYKETKKAFEKIDKKVAANFNSMNGDVANLIMNKETTRKMDGVVVVDHYVASPEILEKNLRNIAEKSGGKIVLGEFGVPISDIHGSMTENEQADWINEALARILRIPEVIGINYWVNVGGYTGLWNENGNSKSAVSVITNYYIKNKQNLSGNPIFKPED